MRNIFYSLFAAAMTTIPMIEAVNCDEARTPVLVDSMGNAVTYPFTEGAIQITSQDTDTVTFSVAQVYANDGTPMFAISYEDNGEVVCDMEAYDDGTLVEYEYISSYTATCTHGFTDVGIYLYVGANTDFTVDECEACKAPNLDYVGHYVRIPCICAPECQPSNSPTGVPTSSPTAAPTPVPTSSPTAAPTPVPTEGPTDSPSGAPSKSPTEAPSASPTGGPTTSPTDSPSKAPTASPTNGPTDHPSEPPTGSPSGKPSAPPTKEPSVSPTETPSSSPSESPSGSYYPSSEPTDKPSLSMSPSNSPSGAPSNSPTSDPTESPTVAPTNVPTDAPSDAPSSSPSGSPTDAPSASASEGPTIPLARVLIPTDVPTMDPECAPTPAPTDLPSDDPSASPTDAPSASPTDAPSASPTDEPSASPTDEPSASPTDEPSASPSASPTDEPTKSPSESPSGSYYPSTEPTDSPTISKSPSDSPSKNPTKSPSDVPTESSSNSPSKTPTKSPSKTPTDSPSKTPTGSPSKTPTGSPSESPSASPSAGPTVSSPRVLIPTDVPTMDPECAPTPAPTDSPSDSPTSTPSATPTGSPSASPSDSPSAGPSATPTSSPSDSPSATPTATPTASPTDNPTVSMHPTYTLPDCYEGTRMVVKDSSDLDICVYHENMVEIIDMEENTVTITVNDVWTDDGTIPETLTIYEHSNGIDSIIGSNEGDAVQCSDDQGIQIRQAAIESPEKEEYEIKCQRVSDDEDAMWLAVIDVVITDSIICATNDVPNPCGDGTIPEACSWRIVIPCDDNAICTDEPSSSPSDSPSSEPSATPTSSPSDSPSSGPSATPTSSPSDSPTGSPSMSPSGSFSASPTDSPSHSPSKTPTASPSGSPTGSPSGAPAASPSGSPTGSPSGTPTASPSGSPTASPSSAPSTSPSGSPTGSPTTRAPSGSPSESPSGSFYPSTEPTDKPTSASPTLSPTDYPTFAPTTTWYPTTAFPTLPLVRSLPTPAPTTDECVENVKTKLVDSTGNTDFYPDYLNPITVLNQYVENVTISVSQIFDEEELGMMGIKYTNSGSGVEACETEQMVSLNKTIEVSAQCENGFAEVFIYLYTGDCWEFPRDNYQNCTLPNPDKFVVHHYKVPCTPVCKPTVPDCLDGPIVTHPDIGEETDICIYNEMPIMIEKDRAGSDWVNFTVQNTWTSDRPADDEITSVSISYISETGEPICETFDSFPEKFETTRPRQAFCEDGLSTVVVNVHAAGIRYIASEISGNECIPPADMGTCAYQIILPCDSTMLCESEPPSGMPSVSASDVPTGTPTELPTVSASDVPTPTPTASASSVPTGTIFRALPTSPAPTAEECPYSDAEFVDIDGTTMYEEIPIKINFQNTSHVGFTVKNVFGGTISSVFTQYQSGSFGQSECLEEENVEDQVSIDFVAQCIRHTKIAIVNVWMTDCSTLEPTFLEESDNALIPECCHPGEECRTVQYTFKLPCVPEPCPEDEVETSPPPRSRMLNRLETIANDLHNPTKASLVDDLLDSAPGEAPASSRLAAAVASIPSIRDQRARRPDPFNESEQHFCVSEDYPCGKNGDMVHVCHYSAREGYKTVCLTEEDTDAIQFFPKDYCGPCVGGFASV